VKRTVWLEVEIDADDEQDARDQAACGHWESQQDASGGRGLGDDDYEVLDIERDDDEDDDETEDSNG